MVATTHQTPQLMSGVVDGRHGDTMVEDHHEKARHLTLFDLVCIGIGSTVGSGIFVLSGLIAKDMAGPVSN